MVRQRPRKSVEELYATKFETAPTKSQVNNNGNHMQSTKNMRSNDRDYTGYIITSNTPYNTSCSGGMQANSGMASAAAAAGAPPITGGGGSISTGRTRKSSRPMKTDKFFVKEDKVFNLEDIKKEHNSKSKTSRTDKCAYNNAIVYDNKQFVNFSESSQKDMHQQHHHHHLHQQQQQHQMQQHSSHDDDKDDDTEEFFELIKQTVENAIGKSISDLLNRNFRELSAKVDRFSSELKATNLLLNKLQTEMNNKVVHYGEENSRHFRYLCMKSEYDKMFYQHHTMLASNSPTAATGATTTSAAIPENPIMEKRRNGHHTNTSAKATLVNDCDKVHNPCSCRNSSKTNSAEPTKSSEHSMSSNKSSEMGMRELLEHIQRFCTQMQLNDMKCDEPMAAIKNSFRIEDALKINKQVFEEDDDDDYQISSDGMTPRSDDHVHKYGGSTMRSCSTTRGGNGGGGGGGGVGGGGGGGGGGGDGC